MKEREKQLRFRQGQEQEQEPSLEIIREKERVIYKKKRWVWNGGKC